MRCIRLLFFLSALFVAAFLWGCSDAPKAPPAMLPVVDTMAVTAQPVPLKTELPGRVSAFQVSDVRPQVSGIIQKRLFAEGSHVTRGEALYQIDPALYQAAHDNARADLMRAQANLHSARLLAERYAVAVKVNGVSKQQYDDAAAAYAQGQAGLASAKAALDAASINLDYTQVRAPISGHIGKSQVTPGALVTAGQAAPLAQIHQVDKMYVDVTQASAEILRLKQALADGRITTDSSGAASVTLRLEDGGIYAATRRDADGATRKNPIVGALQFADITVDPGTGAVVVRAVFPNPEGLLLPGMYVRATLQEGVNEKGILLPQKALVRDAQGRALVMLLGKNPKAGEKDPKTGQAAPETVVMPRPVVIDRSIAGKFWLVSSGLTPGELVIVDGLVRARPGMPARSNPQPPALLSADDPANAK